MEFEGGVTAAFTMVAFTEEICQRKTTIYGSKVARKHSEAHANKKQYILLNAALSELRHTCVLGWTVSVHPSPKPCFLKANQLIFTCPDETLTGRAVLRRPPGPCV